MKRVFPAIQKLGQSLMLPIAVLPVASLLLRFGQPDLLEQKGTLLSQATIARSCPDELGELLHCVIP